MGTGTNNKGATPSGEGAKSLKVGNREFSNIEDLTKWAESLEKTVGSQGAELGPLREMKKKWEDVQKSKSDRGEDTEGEYFQDWETKFYEDPANAMKSFAGYIRKEIQGEIGNAKKQASDEFHRVKSQDDAWGKFYSEYPHLKPLDHEIRETAETKILNGLPKGLPLDEQFKAIADHFEPRLDEIVKLKGGMVVPDENTSTEMGGAMYGSGAPAAADAGPTFVEQIEMHKKGKLNVDD